jgi:hypothetical protein
MACSAERALASRRELARCSVHHQAFARRTASSLIVDKPRLGGFSDEVAVTVMLFVVGTLVVLAVTALLDDDPQPALPRTNATTEMKSDCLKDRIFSDAFGNTRPDRVPFGRDGARSRSRLASCRAIAECIPAITA